MIFDINQNIRTSNMISNLKNKYTKRISFVNIPFNTTIKILNENNKSQKINQNKFFFRNIQNHILQKYNITKKEINKFQINKILTFKNCHLVSKFKDCLISDFIEEFLRRFYKIKESKERIPKFSEYYKNYLLFFCKPKFSDFFANKKIEFYFERKGQIYYIQNYKNKKREIKKEKNLIENTILDSVARENIENISQDNIYNISTSGDNTIYLSNDSTFLINGNKFFNDENSFSSILHCFNNKNNINDNKIEKINKFNFSNSTLEIIKKTIEKKSDEINKNKEIKTQNFNEKNSFKNQIIIKNQNLTNINNKKIKETSNNKVNNNINFNNNISRNNITHSIYNNKHSILNYKYYLTLDSMSSSSNLNNIDNIKNNTLKIKSNLNKKNIDIDLKDFIKFTIQSNDNNNNNNNNNKNNNKNNNNLNNNKTVNYINNCNIKHLHTFSSPLIKNFNMNIANHNLNSSKKNNINSRNNILKKLTNDMNLNKNSNSNFALTITNDFNTLKNKKYISLLNETEKSKKKNQKISKTKSIKKVDKCFSPQVKNNKNNCFISQKNIKNNIYEKNINSNYKSKLSFPITQN